VFIGVHGVCSGFRQLATGSCWHVHSQLNSYPD
jgi:hypothetical protein